MFQAYLHYCCAQVTAMRSAEQALAYLGRQPVDAITTDVSTRGVPPSSSGRSEAVRGAMGCP
jgi:hypothetical protein